MKAKDLLHNLQENPQASGQGALKKAREESSVDKGLDEDEQKHLSSKNKDKVNEAYENISKRLEALRRYPEDLEDSEDLEEGQPEISNPDEEDVLDEDDPLDNEDDKDTEDQMTDDSILEDDKPKRRIPPEEDESESSDFHSKAPVARNFDDSSDLKPTLRKSSYPDDQDSSRFQHRETTLDNEDSLDDLAREDGEIKYEPERDNAPQEMHIPNLHSPKPPINYNYQNRNESFEKKSSKLNIFILGFIALAVIGGTVYLLKNQSKTSKTQEPLPTMTASITTPAPTVSPTPAPLDRTKFKVRVLNGTTKTGMAASVAGKLKDLGYQTEKVGNATNSAFVRTVVRVKSTSTGLAEQLVKDLVSNFDAAISTPLKDTDTVDGEVILGTK